MSALLDRIDKELQRLNQRGRLRALNDTRERSGVHIEHRGDKLLNLSSNDYLGLAARDGLRQEFLNDPANQASNYALTSSSSRLLTGNHPLYHRLEQELATLYQREAALVFNSGYHANTGILPALSTRHDLILSDKLNHASIIDGGRIAEATVKRYRHLDYDHLEAQLKHAKGQYQQIFIVTESIFSMDGDLANLPRLCDLKDQYDAYLIVDEAHGAGTFGATGLGLCQAQQCTDRIDMIVGTFGKALASSGAYAIMDKAVCDYLINTMRTVIFTTALAPINLAWSLKMLEQQSGMGRERAHLLQISSQLRQSFAEAGITTAGDSHIVPAILGPDNLALDKAALLRNHGVLALPVRPPTVPEGTARLRFSLRADLSWEHLQLLPQLLKG